MSLWDALRLPLTLLEERAAEAKARTALLEAVTGEKIDTSVPAGYRNASASDESRETVVSASDYYVSLESAMRFYLTNCTYGGLIDRMASFVMGSGPVVKGDCDKDADESEHEATEAADAYWQACWDANEMDVRDKEFAVRLLRDGDLFVCWANDAGTGLATRKWELEDGTEVLVPRFKLLVAERVKDVKGIVPYGIELDADGETPTKYHYLTPDKQAERVISAEYVDHLKFRADSNWARGYPFLLSSFRWFPKMDRFLDASLNRVELQSCIVLQKKYTNATAALTARTANLRTGDDNDTNKQKRLHPGTVITTSGDVEYDFKHPNMSGAQASDLRLFDLQTVRASGLSEPSVTGDASNNNRASMDVARDPEIRTYEYIRDLFEHLFRQMRRRVVQFGRTENHVPAGATLRCSVEWPPLITRNQLEEAQALTLDVAQGLSKETYLVKRGYDPEKEKAQREQEAEDAYNASPVAQAMGNEDVEGAALKAKKPTDQEPEEEEPEEVKPE